MKIRSPIFSLFVAAAFTATVPPTLAQATYKIGMNVELSGPGASIGSHSLLSAKIALDKINVQGGVNGNKLEFVTEDKDRMSVVDTQGRVQGIGNLWIADASVVPEIMTTNTNLPTIMIAEKISDQILSARNG